MIVGLAMPSGGAVTEVGLDAHDRSPTPVRPVTISIHCPLSPYSAGALS